MRTDDYGLYCLALTLFGAFLFYVVWESSPQYSIPFMGLMSVLAFAGVGEPVSIQKTVQNRFVEIAIPVFMLFLLIYGIFRYPLYVQTTQHFSKLSADQLMATDKLEVNDEAPLYQPIDLNMPCNQLVFQWRNYQENNNAVYQVDFLENRKAIQTEYIDASESDYQGFGIFSFDTIIPDDEMEYAIQIQKISGDKDCNLNFLVYDMYGYNPYPGGSIQSVSKKDRDAALMFELSLEYEGKYISQKKYIWMFVAAELFLAGELFCVLNSEKDLFKKKRKKHPEECL